MWSKLSTESLARATALHPMRVIAVWVVALIVTFGLVVTLFNDALTTEFTFLNGAESKRGETLLQERLQGPESIREVVLVRSANLTVDDPAFKQFAEGIFDETLGLGSNVVASATNYYQTRDESLVSSDRRSIILPLVMAGDFKDAESNVGLVHEVLDRADASSEFEVFITGESTFSQDFTEGAQKDAETGEAFGVPIGMIILAVVFGALAAAALPMILGIASIAIALGLAALIGQSFELHVCLRCLSPGNPPSHRTLPRAHRRTLRPARPSAYPSG